MQQPQTVFRNRVIRALAPDDFGALAPHLLPVRLCRGDTPESAGRRVENIYFPEDCLLSVIGRSQKVQSIDIAMIGFEGMTGIGVVLGSFCSSQDTHLRSPGAAFRMKATTFVALLDQRAGMSRVMLAVANAMMNQTAETALSNGLGKVDTRLARWLLMAADRLGSSNLTFTQEGLSNSLGVRRPSITNSLHRLEGKHLIRSRRAVVSIRDRPGLEAFTEGMYRAPEPGSQFVLEGGLSATIPATSTNKAVPHFA